MILSSDIAFLGLTELSEQIRTGKLSPVDLTETYLARIERIAPKLRCFVTVTADLAIEQATAATKEIAAGQYRGPLHGIPYGAKDLLDTKGIRTTWGAKPYADRVPDRDATVIERLRFLGAVLLGKLAMIELAGGLGYTWPDSSLTGACATPWDLNRWAGGSSSGSGSAVAAGLMPFAIGSETWGSIVCPASFCGVSGLRPTYGTVSRHGAMPLSWTLDKLGPLARSAADCLAVYNQLAAQDPLDPSSTGPALSLPERAWLYDRKPPSRTLARIGFPEGFKVDPAIASAFEASCETMRKTGARIVDVTLPPELPYDELAILVIVAESRSAFRDLIASGRDSELAARAHGDWEDSPLVKSATAVDYVDGMRTRRLVQEALGKLLQQYDAIISPGFPVVAPPIDQSFGKSLDFPDPLGAAGNLAGLPAVCVPCGFVGPAGGPGAPPGGGRSPSRLPVAIQFVGRPFDEANLARIAADYQAATVWHLERPPGVS